MAKTITWENTIKMYFDQMEVGAMRGQQWIKPRLDLSNMESVVLHGYDAPEAKSKFENDPVIYPVDIRDKEGKDFNWGDGILSRVTSGNMPPGEAASWPKEWYDNFANWLENGYPRSEEPPLA